MHAMFSPFVIMEFNNNMIANNTVLHHTGPKRNGGNKEREDTTIDIPVMQQ